MRAGGGLGGRGLGLGPGLGLGGAGGVYGGVTGVGCAAADGTGAVDGGTRRAVGGAGCRGREGRLGLVGGGWLGDGRPRRRHGAGRAVHRIGHLVSFSPGDWCGLEAGFPVWNETAVDPLDFPETKVKVP